MISEDILRNVTSLVLLVLRGVILFSAVYGRCRL